MAAHSFDTTQLDLDVKLVTDPFGVYHPPFSHADKPKEEDIFENMMKKMVSVIPATGIDSGDSDSAFEDYSSADEESNNESSYDEESDYDLYDPWLKVHHVTIKTRDNEHLGHLTYRIVNASARVVGDEDDLNVVWRVCDSARSGKSLKEFVRTLYDTDTGLLCSEYLPNGSRHGNGVFGEEMNEGSFAYLSAYSNSKENGEFFIESEFQGRGIGSWALQELFKLLPQDIKFVFINPQAPSNRMEEGNVKVHEFLRKAGFRRVGQTPYFAYALCDPKHPSRMLSVKEDEEWEARKQDCQWHLTV